MCVEKKKGGLCIRDLFVLKMELLGKRGWRFAFEMESLWKQVIVGKFGVEGGVGV